jgi:phosphatidylinositol-4,5-bisphosphate 3-kinase catalytic subunit beta isoform
LAIKDKLSVTINSCSKLNQSENSRIAVKVGLYHGRESLTSSISTADTSVKKDSCIWNENCTFDINLCDVPRMARFCFVVYEILIRSRKGSRGKLFRSPINCEINALPLKWVNTPVFDYKNILKTGSVTLSMWNCLQGFETEDMLSPLGTVMPNSCSDDQTCLTITFTKYNDTEVPIVYSSFEQTKKKFKSQDDQSYKPRQRSKYFDGIRKIIEKDPLMEMSEQDKELIWYFRKDCCKYLPESLPHLLTSVKWNDHKCVSEILEMVQNWPLLEPEKALELLDYTYPDVHIRSFAIKCLKQMNDEDILLYLLQLVQALKYESYFYCDLSLFLLERALANRIIGHNLFWLLKSEMNEPSTSIYFGLILEAYCRGAIDHMKTLTKQMEAVNKLKELNEIIKKEVLTRKDGKEKIVSFMQEMLEQSCYKDAFKDIVIPLDPKIKLKDIRIEKCKLMDSKMKPLWLVFRNKDLGAEDTSIIFKNGDGE